MVHIQKEGIYHREYYNKVIIGSHFIRSALIMSKSAISAKYIPIYHTTIERNEGHY